MLVVSVLISLAAGGLDGLSRGLPEPDRRVAGSASGHQQLNRGSRGAHRHDPIATYGRNHKNKSKSQSPAAIALRAAILQGCASHPDSIVPESVSAQPCLGLSCEGLEEELIRATNDLAEASRHRGTSGRRMPMATSGAFPGKWARPRTAGKRSRSARARSLLSARVEPKGRRKVMLVKRASKSRKVIDRWGCQ